MMFGTILTSGIEMIAKAGFTQRNITIAALSLSVGIGFTAASETDIWHIFPQLLQSVFSAKCGSCSICNGYYIKFSSSKRYGYQTYSVKQPARL